ncbi:MAG: hypothetical protein SFT91_06460 [Rickettsiaceae bacterium]|nr:hypothetical protein [Rickettsiaceae bacterium]
MNLTGRFTQSFILTLSCLHRSQSLMKHVSCIPHASDNKVLYSEATNFQNNAQQISLEKSESSQIKRILSEIYACKANELYENKKFYDSMILFENAANYNPGSSQIMNNLGVVLTKLEEFSLARSVLEDGYKLNPNSTEINNNLGVAIALEGHNRRSALPYFARAKELYPESEAIQFNFNTLDTSIYNYTLVNESYYLIRSKIHVKFAKNEDLLSNSLRNTILSQSCLLLDAKEFKERSDIICAIIKKYRSDDEDVLSIKRAIDKPLSPYFIQEGLDKMLPKDHGFDQIDLCASIFEKLLPFSKDKDFWFITQAIKNYLISTYAEDLRNIFNNFARHEAVIDAEDEDLALDADNLRDLTKFMSSIDEFDLVADFCSQSEELDFFKKSGEFEGVDLSELEELAKYYDDHLSDHAAKDCEISHLDLTSNRLFANATDMTSNDDGLYYDGDHLFSNKITGLVHKALECAGSHF